METFQKIWWIENVSYMFAIQIPLLMYFIIHQPLAAIKPSAMSDIPESKAKAPILSLPKIWKIRLWSANEVLKSQICWHMWNCNCYIALLDIYFTSLFSSRATFSDNVSLFPSLHIIPNRLNQIRIIFRIDKRRFWFLNGIPSKIPYQAII